ncbi:uncharacterized protein METZ01_LOCUS46661 [marine metagenome]|uniref:Uncharacterized protein n=1 Tax=marine metagenome TaxID=408172 RepID=A0A381RV18_9ZZZZ
MEVSTGTTIVRPSRRNAGLLGTQLGEGYSMDVRVPRTWIIKTETR